MSDSAAAPEQLEIVQPDDWHLHLRDGAVLKAVIDPSTRHHARAIVMPNLVPPVVTRADAEHYRERIEALLNRSGRAERFRPLMTLYLTDATDADDVIDAWQANVVQAVKLYPAGATTNSASGVTSIDRVMPVLERMASVGMPLLVHGEVTDPAIDIFDREARFIETVLDPLRRRLPTLRVVMEHITTEQAVEYLSAGDEHLAATVTPHHLLLNRNALFAGGIRPHYYCLPVLKRERHREALVRLVTGGHPRAFLGTDSAPHVASTKESACGCAGVFNAPLALSVVATVFDEAGALERLEGFTSRHGPAFHGLPVNRSRLRLQRRAEPVALSAPRRIGDDHVLCFDPGRPLYWHVERILHVTDVD